MEDERQFNELAARLREAHLRVAAMPLASEEKASITRRLLTISDAAKRDLLRAAQRLDAFVGELDGLYRAPEDDETG